MSAIGFFYGKSLFLDLELVGSSEIEPRTTKPGNQGPRTIKTVRNTTLSTVASGFLGLFCDVASWGHMAVHVITPFHTARWDPLPPPFCLPLHPLAQPPLPLAPTATAGGRERARSRNPACRAPAPPAPWPPRSQRPRRGRGPRARLRRRRSGRRCERAAAAAAAAAAEEAGGGGGGGRWLLPRGGATRGRRGGGSGQRRR